MPSSSSGITKKENRSSGPRDPWKYTSLRVPKAMLGSAREQDKDRSRDRESKKYSIERYTELSLR
jgi:hypothetical protein